MKLLRPSHQRLAQEPPASLNPIPRNILAEFFLAIFYIANVWIVQLAVKTWNKSLQEIAGLFSANGVYGFIREMYEEFHVQGDAANLLEIGEFLKTKGIAV